MSRYDYSDPGLDRDYCDGQYAYDTPPAGAYCIYCGAVLDRPTSADTSREYCSRSCAVLAEAEDTR